VTGTQEAAKALVNVKGTPVLTVTSVSGLAGLAGIAVEITTEWSAFSTEAVDASKFEVPAGFKQLRKKK
jgi:hypothetical protein